MKQNRRLDEIKSIIINDSKSVKDADKTIRSLNDRDIDYLISRIEVLEQILRLIISIPQNDLMRITVHRLAKEGLKE